MDTAETPGPEPVSTQQVGDAKPLTYEERLARVRAIQERIAALPVLDPRSGQEIMDDFYDENGLPK